MIVVVLLLQDGLQGLDVAFVLVVVVAHHCDAHGELLGLVLVDVVGLR